MGEIEGEGPGQRGVRGRALEGDLERGLAEHLPGLEIVDRDLEVGAGERRAEFAALDGSGRPVLILAADGHARATALRALEALAFARAHGPALARHLDGRRASPATSALVVLVADAWSSEVLDLLGVLAAEDLRLYSVETLRSASGERAWLVPVELGPLAPRAAPTLEGFLEPLGPAEREAVELAVRRVARIDARLEPAVGEGALRWLDGPREVCALVRTPRGLAGEVAGEARVAIGGRADVDRFVEGTVRAWGQGHAGPAGGDDEAPFLTAEEIAAFHG